MTYKIVSDSSANLSTISSLPFDSVPLHIIVGEDDFVDNDSLDLVLYRRTLAEYKGKTSTSCPSMEDWEKAFEGADVVFCTTISGNISGAYSGASAAAEIYMENNPGKTVYVINSFTTGPELVLIVSKLEELIASGIDHAEIYKEINEYMKKTHLYFVLTSLDNFAKNGRISPLVAKGIGALGLRICGRASDEGTLQPMSKKRGDKKAYQYIIDQMKELGYKGGKVIISHTDNIIGADEMKSLIRANFGVFNGFVMENKGLCSYYAEKGAVLIGFER